MIDVQEVLRDLPHFEAFCSVRELQAFVEVELRNATDCSVEKAGTSVAGLPIYHVRFGRGRVKALVVAFPHCHEPIGGMTALGLLTLLREGHRALRGSDVEWHIVPCVDPDGALLNEGWTQGPFSLRNHMERRHLQPWPDQVDCSFPIAYKKLRVNQPCKEATILQGLLDRIRPDFFFSLHNSIAAGGAWYLFSQTVDECYYRQLNQLRVEHGIPLQISIAHSKWCVPLSEGISEMFTVRRMYDDLEKTLESPEEYLKMGAASWDYLGEINDKALVFVAELPHLRYPEHGMQDQTGRNLRELLLKLEAANKFLLTVILAEWERVRERVSMASPFYRKTTHDLVSLKDKLCEGVPLSLSASSSRDLLCNPAYDRTITRGEYFDYYVGERFNVLCHCHEFVRLLKTSPQSPEVERATERLEQLFAESFDDVASNINLDACDVIDCDTLARVQLGSGLIALNAVLESVPG